VQAAQCRQNGQPSAAWLRHTARIPNISWIESYARVRQLHLEQLLAFLLSSTPYITLLLWLAWCHPSYHWVGQCYISLQSPQGELKSPGMRRYSSSDFGEIEQPVTISSPSCFPGIWVLAFEPLKLELLHTTGRMYMLLYCTLAGYSPQPPLRIPKSHITRLWSSLWTIVTRKGNSKLTSSELNILVVRYTTVLCW